MFHKSSCLRCDEQSPFTSGLATAYATPGLHSSFENVQAYERSTYSPSLELFDDNDQPLGISHALRGTPAWPWKNYADREDAQPQNFAFQYISGSDLSRIDGTFDTLSSVSDERCPEALRDFPRDWWRHDRPQFIINISNMIRHGKAPYYCLHDGCTERWKRFNNPSDLRKHVESHLPPGSRPWVCLACEQTAERCRFRYAKDLKRHFNGPHGMGVRSRCDDCEASFIRSDGLTKHRKVCQGARSSTESGHPPRAAANTRVSIGVGRRPHHSFPNELSNSNVSSTTIPSSSSGTRRRTASSATSDSTQVSSDSRRLRHHTMLSPSFSKFRIQLPSSQPSCIGPTTSDYCIDPFLLKNDWKNVF